MSIKTHSKNLVALSYQSFEWMGGENVVHTAPAGGRRHFPARTREPK